MYRLRSCWSIETGLRILARSSALALALAVGACASGQADRAPPSSVAGPIAHAAPAELEDDGLPAQTPPTYRAATEPDDPSEPFSPNYGSPNYGSPNYGSPNYGGPNYGGPNYGSPNYGGPNHSGPNYGNGSRDPVPAMRKADASPIPAAATTKLAGQLAPTARN